MSPRIALALVAIAAAALLVVEGAGLEQAALPLEEATVASQARGGPSPVGERIAGVYPLVMRPLAERAEGGSLLDLGRQLNALLWGALVLPAYMLARRRLPAPVALAVAAASVLVPGAVYSATILPDAAAVLLAASSLSLFVEAEQRRTAWLVASGACAIGAALMRPWFAVLPLGLALALALPRVRGRELARWPRMLAVALLAAIAVTGLGGVSGELERALADPGGILRAAAASLGAAVLGAAVLPWILALAETGRAHSDRDAMLLVACTPLLALAAGVSVAGRETGPGLDERPLLALAPLAFTVAAEGLRRGPRPWSLVAAGAIVAVAILAMPVPLPDPALAGAPGAALAAEAFGGTLDRAGLVAAAAVALLATIALLAAGRRRLLLVVALPITALILAGHAIAWRDLDSAAARSALALGVPAGWLDAHSGAAGTVTMLAAGPSLPAETLALLTVGNRSLGAVAQVDPARAESTTGTLPVAVRTDVVLTRGFDLIGGTLAHAPFGTLVRVAPPPRLPVVLEGFYPDGWTSDRAVYRRIGGAAPDVVAVTVSRRVWTGPDVPGTVTVLSGRVGGRRRVWSRLVIHSGEERRLSVPVPPPPFEVVIAVSPTFSPADFGQPDTRQLGVQTSISETGP